mmetsp:Transcript_6386/g.17030  ORF Transcript_6386/g.17030 Transcript_6386/m.17030 type:complete len:142 (+) Transcript_6386:987-1412(+)|eukprot:1148082-Pelagomonas_calceolata.AAC.1
MPAESLQASASATSYDPGLTRTNAAQINNDVSVHRRLWHLGAQGTPVARQHTKGGQLPCTRAKPKVCAMAPGVQPNTTPVVQQKRKALGAVAWQPLATTHGKGSMGDLLDKEDPAQPHTRANQACPAGPCKLGLPPYNRAC